MMRKINEQIRNAQLLAGKVFNSLNEEEKKALSEWESVGANMEVEKSILNDDAFAKWNQRIDRLDTTEQWNEFLSRMHQVTPKGKVVRIQLYKAVASIAAILVIGLVLFVTFQKLESTKPYQTTAEANIEPGTFQAQLILNNGEVVDLESSGSESINEGNLAISNEKGLLEYKEPTHKKAMQSVINTLRIPRGGEYQLVLPDGTKVWLNSDTELKYSVPFTGNERRVTLTGEAYFDVMPNKHKPFIVETDKQEIEVLGTEFNVSAYNEDLNIITTLVEGRVKVELTNANQVQDERFLLPNEQLVLNKETDEILNKEIDPYAFTSWKDGRFTFTNEPLESFFKKISRWYDVEVFITDESVKYIRFTGDLPRYRNMQDVLRILEAEMSVHIEIEDNRIIYVSK